MTQDTEYPTERNYDEFRTFLDDGSARARNARASRTPWSYEYVPFFRTGTAFVSDKTDPEVPNFEVYDFNGILVFHTNMNSPPEKQELNARLAVAAPRLLRLLKECALLLADHDQSLESEGRLYRRIIAAIKQAS